MGVRLYKHLPLKIKKLDNFNRFRKEVKSTLLKNLFYMLEEFVETLLVVVYVRGLSDFSHCNNLEKF